MRVDPRLLEYYESLYSEADRLARREGQLELARTKELLARFLPAPPARILDVGGATGVYASWLAELGYEVHLVDVVLAHVEAALSRGTFTASVGDARALAEPDASFDVVMVMGPLYHLREVEQRLVALGEAARVVRPGGMVVAAFISRGTVALDGFVKGWIWPEGGVGAMEETVGAGFLEADRRTFGVISYFHLPRDARSELDSVGLEVLGVFGVEGPGWIAADFEERWATAEGREVMVRAARAIEADPELQVLSAHLLGFARRPDVASD
ncbi:MAG: class I SAM-dependent methyltransferase [Chloroflexota bacterium]|nr:class I SAM-dependent methyltransferase [Chloroflexota bacterium]